MDQARLHGERGGAAFIAFAARGAGMPVVSSGQRLCRKRISVVNSQVTICWIVIFITDIGIHKSGINPSVAVIGNRRIAVRSRGAGNFLY